MIIFPSHFHYVNFALEQRCQAIEEAMNPRTDVKHTT